jgi:hypothetical protein
MLATLSMALAVILVLTLARRAEAGALLLVTVGGATGFLVYVGVGLALGVEVLYRLPAMLLGRE